MFASFFLQDFSGLIFEIQSALEFTADTFKISYQMNIFLNKYHGRTCSCQHGLLVLETPFETQFLTKTLNLKHHCLSYAHRLFCISMWAKWDGRIWRDKTTYIDEEREIPFGDRSYVHHYVHYLIFFSKSILLFWGYIGIELSVRRGHVALFNAVAANCVRFWAVFKDQIDKGWELLWEKKHTAPVTCFIGISNGKVSLE